MYFFKVWDVERKKKTFVIIRKENDVYEDLILEASHKLDINGVSLVLEADGTTVDEDEVLIAMKTETFILLEKNQKWMPKLYENLSLASTATLQSGNESDVQDTLSVVSENVSENERAPPVLEVTPITLEVIDCNTEYLWQSFSIPWEKLPEDILRYLESGDINKSITTEIVHVVVNEMLSKKNPIPSKAFKIIAHKMTSKYPKSFQDVDEDGVIIGDGACSLKCKLQERYSYLRRPHKRARPEHAEFDDISASQLKRRRNSMAGCSNWAPPSITENQEDQLSDKQLLIKDLHVLSEERLSNLLEKTYPEIRFFLNQINSPTVQQIKEEWPIIFDPKVIRWHFNRLTGTDIDKLSTGILAKEEKLIEFGIKKKLIKTAEIKKFEPAEATLNIFAKYFKEDLSKWVYYFQNGEDSLSIDILAPIIIVQNTGNAKCYCVFFEKEEVIRADSLAISLDYCLALYFILNVQYPKNISTVLEMLQRYYYKIHPDSGSKSSKISSSKTKVIGLMNKLKNV